MGDSRISLQKGDITKMDVDCVVNAANSALQGGGGVDGAIHRAGGPEIMAELDIIRSRQGKCRAGDAVITSGGKLPARHVVHAVGPRWGGGEANEEQLLASAYRRSLELAAENGCRTVAFPNISTGVYGYPKAEAAKTAIRAVKNFLAQNTAIEQVIFVCYDDENYKFYEEYLDGLDNE